MFGMLTGAAKWALRQAGVNLEGGFLPEDFDASLDEILAEIAGDLLDSEPERL